jgi:hypothetical protein
VILIDQSKMKRFLLPSCNYFSVRVESRKLLQCYMCCELVIWSILSYSAVYYGKIFDYRFTDPSEFTSRIDTNLYYELMFGHLNLTKLDVKEQRETQGELFLSRIIRAYFFLSAFWSSSSWYFRKMWHAKYSFCVCIWHLLDINHLFHHWLI